MTKESLIGVFERAEFKYGLCLEPKLTLLCALAIIWSTSLKAAANVSSKKTVENMFDNGTCCTNAWC